MKTVIDPLFGENDALNNSQVAPTGSQEAQRETVKADLALVRPLYANAPPPPQIWLFLLVQVDAKSRAQSFLFTQM